jgi:hypothetical protein
VRVDDLFKFMEKRHSIFLARQDGKSKPWTSDRILQSYRFCNVYRELDRETIWLRQKWREPNSGDPRLFFAMLVARTINWSPTLEALGYPCPWDTDHFYEVLGNRRDHHEKIWTGAYMVTTHKKPIPKDRYYAAIFGEAWGNWRALSPKKGETLEKYHGRLMMALDGIGSFIAGQVIADLKHDVKGNLFKASDWNSWSAPGTGSIRGMNRVLDRPYQLGIDHQMWKDTMAQLSRGITARMNRSKVFPSAVDAQDLQNCLCEFDKYERARLGQGKPRSTYNGV